MKRYFIPFALLCATLTFASCGDNEDNDIDVPTEEVVPGTNHNVLVAYFSEPLPDGVDARHFRQPCDCKRRLVRQRGIHGNGH